MREASAPIDLSARTGTDAPVDDHIIPFLIDGTDVRGRIARMGGVVDDILGRHADLTEDAARLLGEATVLTALLGSGLKFDGKIIVQARGDGPVNLLVADYEAAGGVRAAATAKDAAKGRTIADLMGEGHFAITIDQGADMRRYQGVVPLEGEGLAECAQAYFDRSEQIPTAIRIAVVREMFPGGRMVWRAGGLMIQHLPGDDFGSDAAASDRVMSAKQEDDWRRAEALMRTVGAEEMTDARLHPNRLLWRLFHEDGVRVFDGRSVMRTCSCSREKIAAVLRRYDEADLQGMREDGRIVAVCEFCRTEYAFGDDIGTPHD